jgi:hypothetical protein
MQRILLDEQRSRPVKQFSANKGFSENSLPTGSQQPRGGRRLQNAKQIGLCTKLKRFEAKK